MSNTTDRQRAIQGNERVNKITWANSMSKWAEQKMSWVNTLMRAPINVTVVQNKSKSNSLVFFFIVYIENYVAFENIHRKMVSKDENEFLIVKETLSPGTKFIPFTDGTRVSNPTEHSRTLVISMYFCIFQVKFHYQTRTCSVTGDQIVLDDSKKANYPMEIVIGKKFKFEVWEVIIQKMSLNEVAKFRVDKSVNQMDFLN